MSLKVGEIIMVVPGKSKIFNNIGSYDWGAGSIGLVVGSEEGGFVKVVWLKKIDIISEIGYVYNDGRDTKKIVGKR
jgi:hypothetical protein